MNNDAEIITAIAEHLGLAPEDVDRKADLKEDLELGPLELTDLLNFLAERFDITLDPNETENLRDVSDVIVLVEDNMIG